MNLVPASVKHVAKLPQENAGRVVGQSEAHDYTVLGRIVAAQRQVNPSDHPAKTVPSLYLDARHEQAGDNLGLAEDRAPTAGARLLLDCLGHVAGSSHAYQFRRHTRSGQVPAITDTMI